jgi:large-conductance mechanosensitive channel
LSGNAFTQTLTFFFNLGGFSSCWGKTIGNFLVFLGVNFAIFFGKIRPQTLKTTKLEKKKKKKKKEIEKEKKKTTNIFF